MNEGRSPHPREDQTGAAADAACNALIALERLTAMPDMRRFPELEAEIAQAKEALRDAVRQLRIAGLAKPATQELDFVLARPTRTRGNRS